MNAAEIHTHVWKADPELHYTLLTRMGSFRGLFDYLSDEWKHSEIPEKRAVVERLGALGVTEDDLAAATVETMTHYGYAYHYSERVVNEGREYLRTGRLP
jgi:hypothetical protein